MKVLNFPSTAGFKGWKQFFTKESVSHPAKINLNLLRHIIETYTELGDVVLDPMAGTFSTPVLASLLGRDGVGVDLEERFVKMGLANKELTERQASLAPRGEIIVLKGDARELSKILGKADTIITSPPYEGSITQFEDEEGTERRLQRMEKAGFSRKTSGIFRQADNSPTGAYQGFREGYSPKKVDSIITSPPYEGISVTSYDSPRWTKFFNDMLKEKGFIEWKGKRYSEKEWRALNHGRIDGRTMVGVPKGETGYDAVITSPPYSEGIGHGGGRDNLVREKGIQLRGRGSYNNPVDAVITSPPYSDLAKRNRSEENFERNKFGDENPFFKSQGDNATSKGYDSKNHDNIGNLKSASYLEAMRQVYAEMFKVLKPDGKAILVVKNFIRNKKVVDLAGDTVKLCESVGFKLVEHILFKLPQLSFWRVLYKKKYPEVDTSGVEHEHILVFNKQAS